jgi:hypothetical protein
MARGTLWGYSSEAKHPASKEVTGWIVHKQEKEPQ